MTAPPNKEGVLIWYPLRRILEYLKLQKEPLEYGLETLDITLEVKAKVEVTSDRYLPSH